MNFFEFINNDKFFNPLSSKNRKIYFDCIVNLIEKSKEVPVLYDSDARNCVAIYLKNSEYVFQDESKSEETLEKQPERNASAIMLYLRECGWVTPREMGRNGENVANVSANCRRIIEFLRKMCDKGSEGALSNRIFAMYEILKSSFEEDSARAERPYLTILKPLMDSEAELKNELLDLKDSISGIMRIVMELQDTNSIGRFLMKDEILDKFFSDYFFIKNNGLIPSQIAFIRNKLRELAQGELFGQIVKEYALCEQVDETTARERVENFFSELQYFLTVEYEENMELIDTRINIYYNLANTRIRLVMGSGFNLESALDAFLNAIKDMETEAKECALDRVGNCLQVCSQKYIGTRSYEKKRRRERDDSSIGLNLVEMSEEEKERRTREMMAGTRNRFSIEGVGRFLEERMKDSNTIELGEQFVEDRSDAINFASAIMYSGIESFPFEVDIRDDFVETEVARITNMTIRRKRQETKNG
ncbi:MAG: DUF5716 family protein [Muribaculaceae bacterium]|nr:DUF5716 family protein [Muribaculaceae bacterium]